MATRIANLLERPGPSLAEEAARHLDKIEDLFAGITDAELEALMWDWEYWGRPAQQIPTVPFYVWLLMSGRGFGKTRTGAETIRTWTEKVPRILLAGETAFEVRETMIEGESGILATSPPGNYPNYEPSKRRITWPNGCVAACLGLGEEPDLARGPQFYKAWLDELAKWKYVDDAWDNLEMAIRLGDEPQMVVTTTPRPIKLIRTLIADPETIVTRGSSYENISHLSAQFIRRTIRRYEGTRLGRQELHAELLEDVPGALWKRAWINENYRAAPQLNRLVVAVDPAVTSSEGANETGIVVAGRGDDDRGYVLADRSVRDSPLEWGKRAIRAYLDFSCDRIVYEANQGGELIPAVLKMAAMEMGVPTPPTKAVHASRGKRTRAEPVSALYEQGRVSHVEPFEQLEDQLCTWMPEDDSPDRLDALVWAMTEVMVTAPEHVADDLAELLRQSRMHE